MFKEIEYIYTIYQEGSFSKAAQKLYISQPALSSIVKKVERNIDVLIFDRTTTPLTLTAAGKYYISSIRKILDINQEMVVYFKNLAYTKTNVTNIGASSYFCIHKLPQIVSDFEKKYPNYKINLLEVNAADMYIYLRDQIIDMNICTDENEFEDVVTANIQKEYILLAIPSHLSVNKDLKPYLLPIQSIGDGSYRDSNIPEVDFSNLKNTPFLLLREGNDMRKRADVLFSKAKFTPNVIMEFDQLMTSYHVAQKGIGAVFVRDAIVKSEGNTDQLCYYKIDPAYSSRNIHLNYKKELTLHPCAKRFRDYLLSQENPL